MDYTQFKHKFQNLPVIMSRDLERFFDNPQIMRNQLSRWQRKGLVVALRRGMYLLNFKDREIHPDAGFLANQLYGPSYVSLESALNYYGLIPERVAMVSSVTTKKTMRFENAEGDFIYQHIKPQAFQGFTAVRTENGLSLFMAEAEKAVIDFLYLNLKQFKNDAWDVLKESHRFQNYEKLNFQKMKVLAALFSNPKLMGAVDSLRVPIKTKRSG